MKKLKMINNEIKSLNKEQVILTDKLIDMFNLKLDWTIYNTDNFELVFFTKNARVIPSKENDISDYKIYFEEIEVNEKYKGKYFFNYEIQNNGSPEFDELIESDPYNSYEECLIELIKHICISKINQVFNIYCENNEIIDLNNKGIYHTFQHVQKQKNLGENKQCLNLEK